MSIYIKSNSSYGCYQIKKKIPDRFINVNRKKNLKYIKWRNKEKKKFSEKVKNYKGEKWWKNLSKEKKKFFYKKYKKSFNKLKDKFKTIEDLIIERKWYWTSAIGKCKKYKTIKQLQEIN